MLDAHAPDNPRERFTTMSIATHGKSTLQNPSRVIPGRPMNRTDDIDGAQPHLSYLRFGNDRRPNLHGTRDIAGAMPKTLHPTRNKPCRNNSNTDIDGSVPHPYTFKTNRVVNPLEPEYSLSVNPSRAPTPPPQLRETMKVDDIEGTRPAKCYKWAPRSTMDVQDIEGAQAGWKPRHKRAHQPTKENDKRDVSDITAPGFRSKRVTDPLNPRHTINGLTIEDEPGMRPKGLPAPKNAPFYTLTTHDIEGARAGWKPKHQMGGIQEEDRRHFRNINFVSDIEGTAAGSKVNGMRTKRVTDPNNPVYPLLDGAVYDAPRTAPTDQRHLHSASGTEVETLRRQVESLKKDLEITRLQAEISRLKGRPATGQSGRLTTAGSYSRGSVRSADRMVLRSADGRPRVSESPPAGGQGQGSGGDGGGLPPTGRSSRRDIAPVQRAPKDEGRLTPAALAQYGGGPPGRGTFGAGPAGDAASVASYASAASVRSVHSAYSYRSRASARSRARRQAEQAASRRGPTPQQRRAVAMASDDMNMIQALPDRPPSAALSRAGSASFR